MSGFSTVGQDTSVAINKVKIPPAIASDYQVFSAMFASSTDPTTNTTVIDATGASNQNMAGTGVSRHGMKYTGTALRYKKIKNIKFYLGARNGSPTGNMTATMRKVSDDSLLTSSDPVDAATYTQNSLVTFNFQTRPAIPAYDVYLLIEYTGGDATNYIRSAYKTSDVFADGLRVTWNGSYGEGSSTEARMEIEFLAFSETYANDGQTSEEWKSNSEANPYNYGDMGSAKPVSGCRIYWLTNGRPTNYLIQTSIDASTWTTVKTLVAQPAAGAYTEYAFNTVYARYVRVIAQETLVMEIAEFQYYLKVADAILAAHGHGDP
jgi:hypothetical protein